MNDKYYDGNSNNRIKNEINYKENIEILKKIKENIKDSDKILNVVINEKNNSIVYLIGSIHVSQQSCNDIKEMLTIIQPDTIFLELSNERAQLLTASQQQIIQSLLRKPEINWFTSSLSNFYLSIHQNFYYYTTLLSMSKEEGKGEQEQPYIYGNEFRIGYEYSKLNKCSIILGDRDFKTTWNRVFNYLDLKTILETSFWGVKSFFSLYNKPIEEIRKMYNESVNELVNASWKDDDLFRKDLPIAVQRSLINERDEYMASCIRDSTPNCKKMVAIVGKGHIKGISNHINDDKEGFYVRMDLENFQEPTWLSKFGYPILLPTIVLTPPVLSVYSFHKLIKPLSKSKFTAGVFGLLSLELLSTNYLINNFKNKLDKL